MSGLSMLLMLSLANLFLGSRLIFQVCHLPKVGMIRNIYMIRDQVRKKEKQNLIYAKARNLFFQNVREKFEFEFLCC